jgi:cyclohexa-1,5-dienecarbonyl-CoA hydratase
MRMEWGARTTMYQLIRVVERFGGQVAEIVLGPPPGNLITARLVEEVAREIRRQAAGGGDLRHRKAIVVSGAGANFSYGADVKEHRADAIREVLPAFHRFLGDLLACPVPTIAKVRGHCLGGGFEIALACSMMAAADDAMCGLPEIKLGAFPPAASVLLPPKLPENTACRMMLSGANVPAHDLHRLGLINLIAPADGLDAAVDGLIESELLSKSASSLRIACAAARAHAARHYAAHIDFAERLYMDSLLHTSDAGEGVEAFLARRPPKWRDS